MASCDPMESPSGRACEEIRNLRRACIASQISVFVVVCVAILCRGGFARVLGGSCGLFGFQVLEDLFDAILPGDRFVVEELQLGHAPQAQALAELAPQKRRGAPERLRGLAPRLLVPHRRVVGARELQVGETLTVVRVTNPTPGSWTSRAISSESSRRICSPTRSGRLV